MLKRKSLIDRRDSKAKPTSFTFQTYRERSGSALRNIKLPHSMRAAFESGSWPAGRVNTRGLGGTAPFLEGILLEFVQSMEEIESGYGGVWGPVWPSVARGWERDHLGRGSFGQVPDLPWLDTEKCLPLGGGYYGDDLWLVLDYRPSEDEPRVVANEFVRLESGSGMMWRPLAPSFDEFWEILRHYL
jgi:hypothetical protein